MLYFQVSKRKELHVHKRDAALDVKRLETKVTDLSKNLEKVEKNRLVQYDVLYLARVNHAENKIIKPP